MGEISYKLHHYDYSGLCMYCKKAYEPNDPSYCYGEPLKIISPDIDWRCQCGSQKGMLPSDRNCHSTWCPAYKKYE